MMNDESRVKGLLAKANAGDDEAVAALFTEFEPELKRKCKKALERVRARKEKSDLAGSVRRKLFEGFRQQRFAKVRDVSAFSKLLATCVHDASVDAYRCENAKKRKGKKVGDDKYLAKHKDASLPSVSMVAAGKEFEEKLKVGLVPWECAMIDLLLDGHLRKELPELLARKFGPITSHMIGASLAKLKRRIKRELKRVQ